MDEALAKQIGRIARRARDAKRLTQEQVAELLDVTVEFYARMERGKTMPSMGTLYKLSEALEVSADALLGHVPYDGPGMDDEYEPDDE